MTTRIVLFLLLFPFCASAKDLYQIHPFSEQQVQQTYIRLLEDACQYADGDWTNSSFDPDAGYWRNGSRGYSGELGIRPIGSMVLGCGTLLKYDRGLSAAEREDLLTKATAALRYVTATHFTGKEKCPDGRQWGGMDRPGVKTGLTQWESTYWTSSFALGAWLMWDKLDPQLQQDIERVIATQDDFLTNGNPMTGFQSDTKAEENGWDVPCLVLGELMFSTNPHAALWHETALKYMMNTHSTAADLNDTNSVGGRPVNQWVLGPTLFPDLTLENHGRFHPSYIACSSYFLTQAALYYAYAGKPVPQTATHHLMDVWQMFRTIVLPWGETAYPQGMDWELHGLPYINLYAALGTRWQDPFAAHMEQDTLQYMRAWQVMCHGNLTLRGSQAGFGRHAVNVEQAAYGLLAHKIFGPSANPLTARAANVREEGVWDYPYVDFIEHRTLQKFASFSWKNHIMGMLMPIEDHEGNPEFTVPLEGEFIGSFQVAGRGNRMEVVEHSNKQMPNGFETSGTVLVKGGWLKQTLRMISVGNQTVVYEDHVMALTNVTVRGEQGVPIGIENDWLTGGTRLVSNEAGKIKFNWQKPQKPVVLPGAWANVDGRLGVVMMSGSGLAYAQATGYTPGISVCTDILYGSYSNKARQFKAGDEVAHRVGIFFTEVTPQETSKLAKSCKIETTPGGQVLRLKQPDGKVAELPLF
ncbi:MAG TPA: hypothetical protein VH280_24355 [Verrucomicrobiae bacterium]|jgi:hypothetical protein|nr:hypothetical protein [Verrucomicrobiae bacterium]